MVEILGGGHNGPPPPRNLSSQNSPGKLGLTLKGPGFFVYLKSGGILPPSPRISAAERQKILKFGTYVE